MAIVEIIYFKIFWYVYHFRCKRQEAEKQAIADSEPPLEDMFNNIYINPQPDFKVRTCDPVKMVPSL
jgi:hypothetical protein